MMIAWHCNLVLPVALVDNLTESEEVIFNLDMPLLPYLHNTE